MKSEVFYYKSNRLGEIRSSNGGGQSCCKTFIQLIGAEGKFSSRDAGLLKRIEVQLRNMKHLARENRLPVVEVLFLEPLKRFYEVSCVPRVAESGEVSLVLTCIEIVDLEGRVNSEKKVKMLLTLGAWIESNYSENYKVGQIASALGISQSSLERLFHAALGMSPKKYISQVRLYDAATSLLTSKQQSQEVAYEVGYRDGAAFCRAFAKMFGTSPNNYREKFTGGRQLAV